jgi:hypothetical protein
MPSVILNHYEVLVKDKHTLPTGAAQNVEGTNPPTVSARKPKSISNPENSKKSTGPRTAHGKANSRFNALKHGLCAKRLMYSSKGQLLEEDLLKLLESLQEQYGSDDVRIQLLCDAVVTEYWRQGQGLRFEQKFLKEGDIHFGNQGGMALLQRYLTSSQRALLKSLELLNEIPAQHPLADQPAVSTARKNAEVVGKGRALKGVGVNGQAGAAAPKASKRRFGPTAQAINNPDLSSSADTKKVA